MRRSAGLSRPLAVPVSSRTLFFLSLASAAVFTVSGHSCHVPPAATVLGPFPSHTLTASLISCSASCPPLPCQSVRGPVRGWLLPVVFRPPSSDPCSGSGARRVLPGWAAAPGGPESPQPRRPREPLLLSGAIPPVDACLETGASHAAHAAAAGLPRGGAAGRPRLRSPPGHSASARLEAGARPAPCLLPRQARLHPSTPVCAVAHGGSLEPCPGGGKEAAGLVLGWTHRFQGGWNLPTPGAGSSPFPPGSSFSENRVSRTRRNTRAWLRPPCTSTAPRLGLLQEDVGSQAVSRTRKWGPPAGTGGDHGGPHKWRSARSAPCHDLGWDQASGGLACPAPPGSPTGAGRRQAPCFSPGPSRRFG